jgi:probable rRNA maturation factor
VTGGAACCVTLRTKTNSTCRPVIHIDITNEQNRVSVDEARVRAAIAAVVEDEPGRSATISVAIVNDPTIHELNRRYLDHDFATDVLSFAFEQSPEMIDGEIIVSGDMAAATAARCGWPAEDELLLYVIHGALHLVGYDDQSPVDAAQMRTQEARFLALFGLRPPQPIESAASGSRAPQLLSEGIQP